MAKGGRGGAGRGDGAGARGNRGARKPRDSADPTRRATEMGACVELGKNIFTISSGNKARDGDTLRTTKEAMILYIGTHYGEDTSKEFYSTPATYAKRRHHGGTNHFAQEVPLLDNLRAVMSPPAPTQA